MKALTLPLFYLLSLLFCGQTYSADEVILSVTARVAATTSARWNTAAPSCRRCRKPASPPPPLDQGFPCLSRRLAQDGARYPRRHCRQDKSDGPERLLRGDPAEDVEKYPVLLAIEEDGKALTLRNKGPIWVIYPLSDHPELNIEQYHSLMVWQVLKLEGM